MRVSTTIMVDITPQEVNRIFFERLTELSQGCYVENEKVFQQTPQGVIELGKTNDARLEVITTVLKLKTLMTTPRVTGGPPQSQLSGDATPRFKPQPVSKKGRK